MLSRLRSHLRVGRLVRTVCAITVILLASGPAATADAACAETSFSVRVAAEPYDVSGTLCRKTNAVDDRTLVITAHGATYNRLYWDWPQRPESHSLVRRLVSDVSVLNVDLLGSGRSSHPLSPNLTQQAQAAMLHQLVQTMRKRGFDKVVLLGHSSGSGTVTLEAARHHDVDGIVVTGFLHHFPGLAVPLSLYPAAFDPAFVARGLDPGYLTTRPGTRSTNGFYNTAVADPSVIAYDEAHKDVVPWLQAAEFPLIINDPSISRAVNVPVLSLVGTHDGFCESPACPPATAEPAAWSSAARLELHLIANAGHDIHLHGASYADAESAYVRDWLARHFANSPGCVSRKLKVSSNGIGKIRVGASRTTVLKAAGVSPVKVTKRSLRFCVKGGGRLVVALDSKDRATAVISTAKRHRGGGVAPGNGRSSAAKHYRRIVQVRKALTVLYRGKLAAGVKSGKVRWVGAVDRKRSDSAKALRSELKQVGL